MKVGLLTREFPPDVYGGAGVHVEYLARELRGLVDLEVHCLGAPRPGAIAHAEVDERLREAHPTLSILAADVSMAGGVSDCDVVHSHTWYANLAGHLAKLLYGIPHVVTSHSLEPLRPWKAEQLGGGYALSSWVERTAYEAADAIIAVSEGSRGDILTAYPAVDPDRIHVVHNGIDTDEYQPTADRVVLERVGVDPATPSVAFVGRITRQKGVPHLLRAALEFDPRAQLVLLAGAADTPELAAEVDDAVSKLRARRPGVVVVSEMLPRSDVRAVLSAASVFVCPSIYEPLGIVNLEAMACGTAVVASDVGGIPDVVIPGTTGLLVHYDEADTERFEHEFALAVNELLADPPRAAAMGRAGRARAEHEFAWPAIAERTVAVYDAVRPSSASAV